MMMNFNNSLNEFYEALLVFERINLKLDIANCLKYLAYTYNFVGISIKLICKGIKKLPKSYAMKLLTSTEKI
jgi:hypothetical protein